MRIVKNMALLILSLDNVRMCQERQNVDQAPFWMSDNEAVATSRVIHIEEHILAVPRYTDRSCQTDLRPNSSYSMYELVSAKTLDECTIPDERPPPYTPVAKR